MSVRSMDFECFAFCPFCKGAGLVPRSLCHCDMMIQGKGRAIRSTPALTSNKFSVPIFTAKNFVTSPPSRPPSMPPIPMKL